MMLGAAGLLLTETVLPRWLGWLALVLGVALFIPFADFIALIIALLWIIVVSVMLYLGATPASLSLERTHELRQEDPDA